MSENEIFNYNEMRALHYLLCDAIEYGRPLAKVRKYMKMIEKIEKWLEENDVNR